MSKLIKLGSTTLAKQAPSVKAQNPKSETEDKQPITSYNKLLEPLSEDVFISLFRLLKMPSYLAIPIMQIAARQSIMNAKQPIWKQIQYALKSFCPLATKWSIKDSSYYKSYQPEPARMDALIHRHRLKYDLYSDCICCFDYLYGFENEQFEIWFLNDKVLESKLFQERDWVYWSPLDCEEKDMNKLLETYHKLTNQKVSKPTIEQEKWCDMHLSGFEHGAKPMFQDRAYRIAFACGWGSRYDCDITSFYPNWLDTNCL